MNRNPESFEPDDDGQMDLHESAFNPNVNGLMDEIAARFVEIGFDMNSIHDRHVFSVIFFAQKTCLLVRRDPESLAVVTHYFLQQKIHLPDKQ